MIHGFSLGLLLGLSDVAFHFNALEWKLDPFQASKGLCFVTGCYGLALAAISLLVSWRTLRIGAVGGFVVVQAIAEYYHTHPDIHWLPLLAVFLAAAVMAGAASSLSARILGAVRPHRWVMNALFSVAMLLAPIPWLLTRMPADNKADSLLVAETKRPGVELPADSPNVVLITFDTLRADHLGAYGYRKVKTPHLDALIQEGTLFERAQVQAPLTSVSHASMFTGLYPTRHGIRAIIRSPRLKSGLTTLPEALKKAGYATAAVVASAPLAPGSGLENGFDTYDFELPTNKFALFGVRDCLLSRVLQRGQIVRDRWAFRRADEQTRRALRWLDSRPNGPFLLWVHYFDVHDPYAPPSRYLRREVHPGASVLDRIDRWYLYDSELAYLDSQIGRLVEGLRRRHLLEKSILVGISDHGEGLGDHDYVSHSYRLFDEQLHPVFFIRYPTGVPAGMRVNQQVRSIDLFPTLMDLLRLEKPAGIDGVSLLSYWHPGNQQRGLLSLSETLADPSQRLVAASDGRYKVIYAVDSNRWSLYDLKTDPEETKDLATLDPKNLGRLQPEVARYLSEGVVPGDLEFPPDSDLRQRLQSLGYIR
jgi:arylsulfatase A-like enzyme